MDCKNMSKMNQSTLDSREREVLRMRKEGKTLEETGRHYGISRERVRQIQLEAEQKLKTNKK